MQSMRRPVWSSPMPWNSMIGGVAGPVWQSYRVMSAVRFGGLPTVLFTQSWFPSKRGPPAQYVKPHFPAVLTRLARQQNANVPLRSSGRRGWPKLACCRVRAATRAAAAAAVVHKAAPTAALQLLLEVGTRDGGIGRATPASSVSFQTCIFRSELGFGALSHMRAELDRSLCRAFPPAARQSERGERPADSKKIAFSMESCTDVNRGRKCGSPRQALEQQASCSQFLIADIMGYEQVL
eukprot:3840646-Pleurochrysis_carterae.AAC.1